MISTTPKTHAEMATAAESYADSVGHALAKVLAGATGKEEALFLSAFFVFENAVRADVERENS